MANDYRSVPRLSISAAAIATRDEQAKIIALRFSPSGAFLAAARDDGRIRIYDSSSGKTCYSLVASSINKEQQQEQDAEAGGTETATMTSAAVTAIRFHPGTAAAASPSEESNVLLACSSDGYMRHWKMTAEVAACTHAFVIDSNGNKNGAASSSRSSSSSNSVTRGLCLDIDKKGKKFAVGCQDAVVRVYDEETCQLMTTCDGGGVSTFSTDFTPIEQNIYLRKKEDAMTTIKKANIITAVDALNSSSITTANPRHSNRVCSVRFTSGHSAITDHLIISGGWDNTLQLWDLRAPGPSVRSYSGAYLTGDALDVSQNDILTASCRDENQIQIWDLRFGGEPRCVQTLEGAKRVLFAAQFNKGQKGDIGEAALVAAGGIGTEELYVMDREKDYSMAATISGCGGGVVALDFFPSEAVRGGGSASGEETAAVTLKPLLKSAGKLEFLPNKSKKGYDQGLPLAMACANGMIRIVDINVIKGGASIDPDEEEAEDGDRADGESQRDDYGWWTESEIGVGGGEDVIVAVADGDGSLVVTTEELPISDVPPTTSTAGTVTLAATTDSLPSISPKSTRSATASAFFSSTINDSDSEKLLSSKSEPALRTLPPL